MSEQPTHSFASQDDNARPFLSGKLIELNDLVNRYSPPPLEVVPGWLPGDARKMLITGKSKSGKSFIAHELVLALGNGQPFLGLVPLKRRVPTGNGLWDFEDVEGIGDYRRTLYVQAENSEYSMEYRTRRMALGRGGRWGSAEADGEGLATSPEDAQLAGYPVQMVTVLTKAVLDLNDEAHQDALIELLIEGKYKTVVFDSVNNVWSRGFNDEQDAKALRDVLNLIIEATGCLVIAIHHLGKTPSGRESMGSTFFTSAWHEVEWSVGERNADGEQNIVVHGREEEGETVHRVRSIIDGEKHTWEEVKALTPQQQVAQDAFTLKAFMAQEDFDLVPSSGGKRIEYTNGWNTDLVRKKLEWTKDRLKAAKDHVIAQRVGS